jgi:hypothetical protein
MKYVKWILKLIVHILSIAFIAFLLSVNILILFTVLGSYKESIIVMGLSFIVIVMLSWEFRDIDLVNEFHKH